jgi:hypothetical protein
VSRRRARSRSLRRPILLGLGLLVLGAGVFLAGLGLGQALEEGREDPGTSTRVRTLRPVGLPPARQTVTVRVTVTRER